MPKTVDDNSPTSLPNHFQNNGYYTVSIGKVSHSPDGRNHGGSITQEGGDGKPEVPNSWDEVYAPTGDWGTAWDAFFAYAGGKSRIPGETPAYEAASVTDTGYPDGLIAEEAIRKLKDLKSNENPFFFSLGFYKPHLPFNSPKKYWELYKESDIKTAPYGKYPENINPGISLHNSGELTPRYTGVELAPENEPHKLTEESEIKLRHAYFAAVSYIDAQIGKVIKSLKDLQLYENTIIVLWGDHGWHLGDHGIWGKHTLFERSFNSPLIVKIPNQEKSNAKTDSIVETIDIYPTLCELCNLEIPEKLHGKSFFEILNNPNNHIKERAYGYWKRGEYWGKSFRNNRYRFTRWTNEGEDIVQTELYDHRNDPYETKNITNEHDKLVKDFLSSMDEDWKYY
jgi:arylsulfatase A-like enzyme